MTPTTFDYRSGVACAIWIGDGESISIEAHAPRYHGSAVGAEVRVFVSKGTQAAPGPSFELARERVNDLLGSRNQSDLVKKLTGRHPSWPWDRIVEGGFWAVVDAVRQGRPEILLRDAPDEVAEALVLPPLLSGTDPVALFGDGGATKSYLALALAATLHTGRELITGIGPTRTMRVGLLDWEWRPEPHKKRLRRLWGTPDLPDIVYAPCAAEGPLTEQVDRVLAMIRRQHIEYLVVDSVALACDGPPEDSSVALAFFQALARLGVGSCLIAHVNRSGDTSRPFGSQFWHNSCRRTWFVKKVGEAGAESLDLGLFCRKVNDGPVPKPFGLHFDFGPERTIISRADVNGNADLAAELPLVPRMIAALKKRSPQDFSELAEAVDAEEKQVRSRAYERKDTFVLVQREGTRRKQVALLDDREEDVLVPFPGGRR